VTRHEDVVIAFVMFVLGEWQVAAGADGAGDPVVAGPAVVAYSVALCYRRRYALLTCSAVSVCWMLSALLGSPPSSIWALVLVLLASYSVAAHEVGRRSSAGLALLVLAGYVSTWLTPGSELGDRLFSAPVIVGAPWAAGWLARRLREQAHQLAVLNAILEERGEQEIEEAARRERNRIARELHDVVSHGLGMITVQAGAALKVLDVDPTGARSSLEDIRAQGKEALADMRAMLGVLVDGDEHAPRPGIEHLPELIDRLRTAGLTVQYDGIDPSFPTVSEEEEFVVYRVVQEAVTNALKHGSVDTLRLRLHGDDAGGYVDIEDDGTSSGTSDSSGHGLASMRTRAAQVGASIDAGPMSIGRGWRVSLVLPRGRNRVTSQHSSHAGIPAP
jgi:signal transduction histidine kinase